jgi:selenocysteine lyase/cysteine desulfurase
VTTNQDYGRMLDTWEQRVRRDRIKLSKISFPVPPRVARRARRSAARRDHAGDQVLHFCHITNLTGQIFPVKRICDEARRRGVQTIVDGAHAFAHFPYKLPISAATSTARASTNGCSPRSGPASSTSAVN